MPIGKDMFLLVGLFMSVMLALSVHWFLGIINFMMTYGYVMGE